MGQSDQQGVSGFFLDGKGGVHHRKRFEIPPDGLIAGRSQKADIVLPDGRVSREHARFYVKDGFCYVEDMGSRNGVLVQGKRHKKLCLQDGDIIDLGYCSFRVRTAEHRADLTPMPELMDYARELKRGETHEADEEAHGLRVQLHPFALASLGFVVLAAAWYWAFAVGAVVLAALALRDIRVTGKHYGRALAMTGLVLGLFAGGLKGYLQHTASLSESGAASTRCERRLIQVGETLARYAEEHEGRYPQRLEELSYVGSQQWLNCPSCLEAGRTDCIYAFPGTGREHDPASKDIVACDRLSNHHRGGNILRANGTVEWVPIEDLEPMLAEMMVQ